jgi:ketosteroid isomerase-like protein
MNVSTSTSPPGRFLGLLNDFYDAEQRYVAAGGAQAGADFGGVAAHLHPDVVAHQGPTVPYPGDWHGAAGLERFFATFTDTWTSLELTGIKYFEGESGVAVAMRMRATARATGKHLDTRVGHFFTFEDGLIRDIDVFYADPELVKQVTLP